MKIAITGTHSTGKTTIAQEAAEALGIPYVRGDKAVDICGQLFPDKPIDKLTVEDQWELQQAMFKSFDEAFEIEGSCVTDGFHLTCIPYGLNYTNLQIQRMPGYSEFVTDVFDKAAQFDKIFYLPPEIGFEDDCFRPLCQKLRMDIDEMVVDLLSGFEYKARTGNIEERVARILSHTGDKKGLFDNYVALEGLPRSGKTTQGKILKERYGDDGPIYFCERNASKYMKEFKKIRKENWYERSKELIELNVQALLYDMESNNVIDRLQEGQIVVSDRQKFTVHSMFGALGVPQNELYRATYQVPTPGRVMYMNIHPQLSVNRSKTTNQISELKSNIEFQHQVQEIYTNLGNMFGFEIIDGYQDIKIVHEDLIQRLGVEK